MCDTCEGELCNTVVVPTHTFNCHAPSARKPVFLSEVGCAGTKSLCYGYLMRNIYYTIILYYIYHTIILYYIYYTMEFFSKFGFPDFLS